MNGWDIKDGILSRNERGGDIVTNDEFENFVLELKIEKGGNSGIFIYVTEKPENKHMYETGPEFQIIDNENYPQQLTDQQKTGNIQHWLYNKLFLKHQLGTNEIKNI